MLLARKMNFITSEQTAYFLPPARHSQALNFVTFAGSGASYCLCK